MTFSPPMSPENFEKHCKIKKKKQCPENISSIVQVSGFLNKEIFKVLSEIGFCKIWVFEFCHSLSCWVCWILSFWVLSPFKYLSSETSWIFHYKSIKGYEKITLHKNSLLPPKKCFSYTFLIFFIMHWLWSKTIIGKYFNIE